MGKEYVKETIKLETLIFDGYITEKTIKKYGITSGVIFVPKRFVGKKFRMILIPLDETEDLKI